MKLITNLGVLLVAAAAASPVVYGQQKDDPATLQKRIAELEAGQKAILKELQEIKALLQTKGAAPAPTTAPVPTATSVSIENAPAEGDPKARITLVEFSDFECPFCGRYARETYGQVKREYIDTGKIRYVFKNLPLESVHPQALGAAIAGECARAQGKFWELHDRMFQNQRGLTHAALMQSAVSYGLNGAEFEKCLASDAPKQKVQKDLVDAATLGASATPTFLFGVEEKGGKVKVLQRFTGAKSFAVFKATLDALLETPASRH